jgi:hypothetical protein
MANSPTLLTPKGILSFPNFFTPRAPAPGADPRYSCVVIFDEEGMKTAEYKALSDAIIQCAYDEFGKNVNLNQLHFPIRKSEEKSHLQGYLPGTKFVSAWTKKQPGIVDAALREITDPNAIFAGQVVRISVSPFAYSNSGNRGVSLGLRNVQLLKADMPRLDGRGSPEGDFGKAPLPAGIEAEMADEEVPF